jgi:hypothetical protein
VADQYYWRIEQYDVADDPDDAPPRDTTRGAGDLMAMQKRIVRATLELGSNDWLLINIEPLEDHDRD